MHVHISRHRNHGYVPADDCLCFALIYLCMMVCMWLLCVCGVFIWEFLCILGENSHDKFLFVL